MLCSECGLPEPVKAFLQMCVHEDMGEQTHTAFHASRQLSFVAGLGIILLFVFQNSDSQFRLK